MANEKPKDKGDAKGAEAAPAGNAKNPNKLLLIIIGVLVLILVAGAAWFVGQRGQHSGKEDSKSKAREESKATPKVARFTSLEQFTVNLVREEGDQFLQVSISLKYYEPELEEKIKTGMPEIRSKLLLLLSSKRASQLASPEGKKTLAEEIITEVNGVLGIRSRKPAATTAKTAAASQPAAAHAAAAKDSAPANEKADPADEKDAEEKDAGEKDAEDEGKDAKDEKPAEPAGQGIVDVMYTHFIIQ